MSVRAKIRFNGYDASHQAIYPHKKEDGSIDYSRPEMVEMRSLKLGAVSGNGDPEHENTKFWQASPNGQIALGCVNPGAWQTFELGKEYYVDFTPAE